MSTSFDIGVYRGCTLTSNRYGGLSVSAARLALVTLLATPLLQAQKDSPDGLTLLQQMSQHYARATSWYIEAAEDRTVENEYCSEQNKTNIIGAESGNDYHYESHAQTGSALHISDGVTAWDFHPDEHEYEMQTAPAGGYTPEQLSYVAEATILRATRLRQSFADLANHYDSATRLPDEVIHDTGFDIPCYVVRVTSTDRKGPKTPEGPMTDTLWIDQKTWIVQERAQHADTFTNEGTVQTPITIDTFTRYSTVLLSAQVPNALFHFHPPSDAQLVAKFGIHRRLGLDMTGQTAPDAQLVAIDGATAPLSSYRGKPVLLDFWATWCKPCIESFPRLAELQKETAPMGLVLLSVDEDEEEKKATDFLAQHNYVWPNIHDESSTIHQAFNNIGLPHVVLIDAQGTIVFFGSGGDEYGLRTAIAALGPQYRSLKPPPKPQDACKTASKQPPID